MTEIEIEKLADAIVRKLYGELKRDILDVVEDKLETFDQQAIEKIESLKEEIADLLENGELRLTISKGGTK